MASKRKQSTAVLVDGIDTTAESNDHDAQHAKSARTSASDEQIAVPETALFNSLLTAAIDSEKRSAHLLDKHITSNDTLRASNDIYKTRFAEHEQTIITLKSIIAMLQATNDIHKTTIADLDTTLNHPIVAAACKLMRALRTPSV